MKFDESLLIKIKEDVRRVTLAEIFHNCAFTLVSDDPRATDEAARDELLMVTEKIMGLGAQILFDYIAKKVQTGTLTAQGLRSDVKHLMDTIRERHVISKETNMDEKIETTPQETECKAGECTEGTCTDSAPVMNETCNADCTDPEPKPDGEGEETPEGEDSEPTSDSESDRGLDL